MFRTPIARLKQLLWILLVMAVLIYAVDPGALGGIASGLGALFTAIIDFFKAIFGPVFHALFGGGVGVPHVKL